jgi:hypothetical protein
LPVGDVMLAQKIALENDEQAALAVARSFHPSERRAPCARTQSGQVAVSRSNSG